MTDPQEHRDMVNWITDNIDSGLFKTRSQVESYILSHEGKISTGMRRALDDYYDNPSNFPEPILPEPQPEEIKPPEEVQKSLLERAATRLFNALRGVFVQQ